MELACSFTWVYYGTYSFHTVIIIYLLVLFTFKHLFLFYDRALKIVFLGQTYIKNLVFPRAIDEK